MPTRKIIDFLILNPVEVEFVATSSYIKNACYEENEETGTHYFVGTFSGKYTKQKVAIANIGSGTNETSTALLEALHYFSPNVVILVGIAGAVKDAKLGDIVVGTKAYYYESGKQFEHQFAARPKVFNYSHRLIEKAKIVKRQQEWLKRIDYQDRNFSDYNKEDVEVHLGAIACGEKVLASDSSKLVERIKSIYNDTLAIEMEAIGMQILERYPHILALNIRSISDQLSKKSSTDEIGYQEIAAANAAAFTFELIYQYDTPSNYSSSHLEETDFQISEEYLTGKRLLNSKKSKRNRKINSQFVKVLGLTLVFAFSIWLINSQRGYKEDTLINDEQNIPKSNPNEDTLPIEATPLIVNQSPKQTNSRKKPTFSMNINHRPLLDDISANGLSLMIGTEVDIKIEITTSGKIIQNPDATSLYYFTGGYLEVYINEQFCALPPIGELLKIQRSYPGNSKNIEEKNLEENIKKVLSNHFGQLSLSINVCVLEQMPVLE